MLNSCCDTKLILRKYYVLNGVALGKFKKK